MTDVTIKSLAAEIHTPVDYLVKQLVDAGIKKTASDSITQQEKKILLFYLKHNYNSRSNKLTLIRKTRSTLNIPCVNGKNKSVHIEVRKKRTYQQPDTQIEELTKQPIKLITEKKITDITIGKDKHTSVITDKLINQQSKNNVQSLKTSEKIYHTTIFKQKKHNIEEIKSIKIKKKTSQITKNVHIVKNYSNFLDISSNIIDKNITKYKIITPYNSKISEDQSNQKTEGYRRNRDKKDSKKKFGRLSKFKVDRKEVRIVLDRREKNKSKSKISLHSFKKPTKTISRNIIIGETIIVSELASKMAIKGSQVIKVMMQLGIIATINQIIDQETAQLIAEEMGHKVILRHENELEESIISDNNSSNFENKKSRAPIVTIMGHVDHGKTSLLDYIRSTKVAISEAGGITQYIGAYHVNTSNGSITFIDTPGHAAFTAMRSRGAHTTDIIILVISADDGVMPQTIEAIQHAREAKVPIIVAISKIDKPESDPDKIKNELTKYNIIPEEWGGENQFIHISVKSGKGIDELLSAIILQAEILELKAIHNGMASGVVIESFLDRGRGPVATILVRKGTLYKGNVVLCGFEYGRIRAMRNEKGLDMISAGPSIPVEILGLSGIPVSGDTVTVVRDEKKAREVALYRQNKFREVKLSRQKKLKLENIFSNIIEGTPSELNIVLKSDVRGSNEAITNALENLSTNEVKIKIVGSGVGGIIEADAILAAAANAILIGFNVRADAASRRIIDSEHLDLRYYSVIYNLIDEIKKAMSGLLVPEYKHKIIGFAEVRNIFRSPKFGAIAGCMVTEGVVKRHNDIRVLRENIVTYQGKIESLRRFKDNVSEVRNGMECGVGIKNYNDIHVGDIIEVFETIKIERSIT